MRPLAAPSRALVALAGRRRHGEVADMPADDSSPDLQRLTLAEIRPRDVAMAAALADAPYRLKPGTVSASAVAVSGLDGHLFIANGANRWERQYLGELTVAPAWIAGWQAVLARRQAEAAARGIALVNLVVPEKQVVLPECRWRAPAPQGARRPLKLLLPELGPEHRLLYAADALMAAKAQAPTYFHGNSHWTPSACCAVLFELLAAMGVAADPETLRFGYRQLRKPHDLALHFFEAPPAEARGMIETPGDYLFEQRTFPITGRNIGTSFHLQNPTAPDPRRVIVFGDSFAGEEGLGQALSSIFREVRFYWAKDVAWSLVDGFAADLVIWESAERFLVTLPQA
jgi:alginate O-acetyltransferase complex protein AlgJ